MDNYIYHPSLMIPVKRQHVFQIISAAEDLIKDLDTTTADISEQVAACCNRGRPLCRDMHCTKPCIAGDPWDTSLRPKLDDCGYVQEWLSAHGVQHGHPFYRNFCIDHINRYVRIGGEWVEVPKVPTLQRSVVGTVAPLAEQEGPLYYVSSEQHSDEEEIFRDILADISDLDQTIP